MAHLQGTAVFKPPRRFESPAVASHPLRQSAVPCGEPPRASRLRGPGPFSVIAKYRTLPDIAFNRLSPKIHVMTQLETILRQDLGVKETYKHAPKRVTPGAPIEVNGTILKWYRLYSEEEGVGAPSRIPEIEQLARSYLERYTLEAKGLGFVILHQCGA